jgi:5,10-methylenetetrahydromethanopterin reductase
VTADLTSPRFGLGFQSDKTPARYERLAVMAESLGFDVLSVFGDLWYQPPLAALLSMARVTRRVTLGPACLNPFLVHPVEMAGQVAALDAVSGGRAYLGVARGSWLGELGVDQHDAVARVAESVRVVGALLAGDRRGQPGPHFPLPAGAGLAWSPERPHVPVLIGTWSRRLAVLAGGLADEVKIGGSANPAMVPIMRAWLDEGVARRGAVEPADRRPVEPAGRRPGIVMGAVTVVADDGRAARARARREVAMYLEVVAGLDPTVELPPGLVDGIRVRRAVGDGAGAGALIPDDVLDRFALAGTPDQVAARAAALLEAGAARVEFGTPHGLTDDEGVLLLGQRVLPALRDAAGGR